MASGVKITAAEGLSGKSTVALGILDALADSGTRHKPLNLLTGNVSKYVSKAGGHPDTT